MNKLIFFILTFVLLLTNGYTQILLQLNPKFNVVRDVNIMRVDNPYAHHIDDPYSDCPSVSLELLFVTNDIKNLTVGGGLEGYYNAKGFSTVQMLMLAAYNIPFNIANAKFGLEPRIQMNIAINEFNFFMGGRFLFDPNIKIKDYWEFNIKNMDIPYIFYEVRNDFYDDLVVTHAVGLIFNWKYGHN